MYEETIANIMDDETLDSLIEENIDNEKTIKDLNEKLSLAIDSLNFYTEDYDYGENAKETLEQIEDN